MPIYSDNYSYSFGKIRGAIQQLYKIHGDNYDWYMKTDDDTYVVMDNLRTYLLTKNASEEHYLGFKLDFIRKGKRHIYHQGGAGMVFSRAAIKKLVSKGFTSKHKCSQNPQNLDDRIIGRCMENLNINVTDARDYKNRLTFCPASVVDFSTPHKNEQYNKFITKNPTGFGKGMPALSPYPISFHYVP
uniref:N-acetylgalactosaminide beta-1,3-galactosyltransferase n=1 Tax=Rhabditophanes sp. KR3021 TaxID=114890 RepID=A0AC35U3D3_9BILA